MACHAHCVLSVTTPQRIPESITQLLDQVRGGLFGGRLFRGLFRGVEDDRDLGRAFCAELRQADLLGPKGLEMLGTCAAQKL
jgi:hypothetical protein